MKKSMPSLFLELYVSIIASLAFIALLFILIMSYVDSATSTRDFYRDSQQVAVPLLQALKQRGKIPPSLLKRVLEESHFDINIATDSQLNEEIQQAKYIKTIDNSRVYLDRKRHIYIVVEPLLDNKQWLIIKDRPEDIEAEPSNVSDEFDEKDPEEKNLMLSLQITFVCLLFLFAVVLLILIKRINKHIETLLKANEQWRQGRLSARVTTQLPAPLNKLAVGFNSMASDMEKTFNEQNILMGAISHELRTPISKLQLSLNLLERQHLLTNDQYLQETYRFVDELEDLVKSTLTLAKLNHLETLQTNETINLNELIKLRMAAMAPLYPTKNSHFNAQQTLSMESDGFYLNILIDNLLSNAFKYAKNNLTITLEAENTDIVFYVDDDGEGVAMKDRENMLAAFSRLDTSRNKSTGGYGLGLAIVDAIVKHHKGSIKLGESTWGGLRVKITLPRSLDGMK